MKDLLLTCARMMVYGLVKQHNIRKNFLDTLLVLELEDRQAKPLISGKPPIATAPPKS
jgi:hypothetical protein